MEKKTIGAFLAALRKASGMTQKQLAEKLNVSDKAVSRWERDECAPDLALIPVLAEIFGVTSDEILRGQRNNPEAATPEPAAEKREQQVRRILKANKTNYRIRCTVTLGIGFLGLIAAMIANLGFLRAYIGFMVGCIFYGAAIVCQVIFMIQGFSAVEEEEFESAALGEYKSFLIKQGMLTLSGILLLFAATLPLMVYVDDAYWGLTGESWFRFAIPMVLVTAALCLAAGWAVSVILGQRGIIPVEAGKNARNTLRLKVLSVTAVILLIVLISQAIFNASVEPIDFAEGTTFETLEEFKEYMEMPIDAFGNTFEIDTVEPQGDGRYIYYLKDRPYTLYVETEQLRNFNDEPILEYLRVNEFVAEIHYNWNDDRLLPITIYDNNELIFEPPVIGWINLGFVLCCLAVLIGAVIVYSRKRKRILA